MRTFLTIAFRCAVLALLTAGSLAATPITYRAGEVSDYGGVNASCPEINPSGVCGAAAMINSFAFLGKKYPETYGDSGPIPDWDKNGVIDDSDMVTSRNKLAGGWGPARPGLYDADPVENRKYPEFWFETKQRWFEDFAPGTTVFHAMSIWRLVNPDSPYNRNYRQGYPTWEFLLKEIQDGEDVEIALWSQDRRRGHMVTLMGLEIDDKNNDGKWDKGERSLIFQDPNSTGVESKAAVEWDGSRLFTPYPPSPNLPSFIEFAVSESPVPIPEPATLLLVFGGGVALLVLRRGRRERG